MSLKKKPAVASSGRKLPTRNVSPDLAASLTPQQLIERFDEDYQRFLKSLTRLEHSPVFTGRPGCLALDILDRMDKFRDTYRQKAKDYLTEYPGTIPHWQAEMQTRRTLSRDTEEVFDAVQTLIPSLTHQEFLRYCTSSISGLIRLLESEGYAPEQINRCLEETLGEFLSHDVVTSLRRDQEGGK